ncbi:MAG TPA: helix-turn-helix transcriptional regulator [Acidimicrobiales bacterium]|nr:helix-turn-helix transcriptional regulator [Acidimicrobiales bacterium]
MPASSILRAARASRGWSQRELARRCGVAQPSLSDIESGDRDTTVAKLEQILHATGHRLVSLPTTRPTVAEWAPALRDLASEDPGALEKCFVQIADDLTAADDTVSVALASEPPAATGSSTVDAVLAALVEHLFERRGLPIPGWTEDPRRVSAEPWDLITVDALRALARADTPEPFRRRNVFVPSDLFESV